MTRYLEASERRGGWLLEFEDEFECEDEYL
jgi:hypothetical protein